MDKRTSLIALIFIASLLLLAGCTAGPAVGAGKTGTELIPDKASVYTSMDMQAIMNDADFRESLAEGGQDVEAQLRNFREMTGVEPSKVRSVVMFSDEEGEYGGVIITAEYSQEAAMAALTKAREGAKTSTFEGATIVEVSGAEGEGTAAVAFVNANSIAIGELDVVKDVVLVDRGKLAKFSSAPVEKAVAAVGKDKTVTGRKPVFLVASKISGRGAAGAGQVGSNAEALAMGMFKEGKSVDVRMAMAFSSAKDASDAAEQMIALTALMRKQAEAHGGDARTADMLSRMSTRVEGEVLVTTISTTVDELKELGQAGAVPYTPAGSQ